MRVDGRVAAELPPAREARVVDRRPQDLRALVVERARVDPERLRLSAGAGQQRHQHACRPRQPNPQRPAHVTLLPLTKPIARIARSGLIFSPANARRCARGNFGDLSRVPTHGPVIRNREEHLTSYRRSCRGTARRLGGHRSSGHRAGRGQRGRERHSHGRRRQPNRARRHAEHPQHEPELSFAALATDHWSGNDHWPERSAGVAARSLAGWDRSRPRSSTTSATARTR